MKKEAAQELRKAIADKEKLAQQFERERSRLLAMERATYVEVPKIIEKPVYRKCKLDADGVQLINRATRAVNATGKPDREVP